MIFAFQFANLVGGVSKEQPVSLTTWCDGGASVGDGVENKRRFVVALWKGAELAASWSVPVAFTLDLSPHKILRSRPFREFLNALNASSLNIGESAEWRRKTATIPKDEATISSSEEAFLLYGPPSSFLRSWRLIFTISSENLAGNFWQKYFGGLSPQIFLLSTYQYLLGSKWALLTREKGEAPFLSAISTVMHSVWNVTQRNVTSTRRNSETFGSPVNYLQWLTFGNLLLTV